MERCIEHMHSAVARQRPFSFAAVDPSAWNRGIGKTLVREAIDRARENGYKAVVAEYIAPTSAHVGVCRATAIE